MHEVSIARSLLDLAEDYARCEGASCIKTVALRIGALSGVLPEALEFAFEVAKLGTLAADAHLEVEYLAIIAYCESCALEFEVKDIFGIAQCPLCSEPTASLRQGQELELSYLELD